MFDWLTPEVRKAVYGIVTIAFTFSLAYGWVTTEQVQMSVEAVERIIMALTSLMAFLNTHTAAD